MILNDHWPCASLYGHICHNRSPYKVIFTAMSRDWYPNPIWIFTLKSEVKVVKVKQRLNFSFPKTISVPESLHKEKKNVWKG